MRAPEATLLACSFEEVRERLTRRGRHRASIGVDTEALAVASAFRTAQYCDEAAERLHFRQTAEQFCTSLFESHIVWAPDGDAAFDDGSHVLHFDYGDRVRLIAFRNELDQLQFEASVVETLIDAASFYAILEEWQAKFEAEWRAALINH